MVHETTKRTRTSHLKKLCDLCWYGKKQYVCKVIWLVLTILKLSSPSLRRFSLFPRNEANIYFDIEEHPATQHALKHFDTMKLEN